MNNELKAIAVEAGAPEEMLNKLWFNVFCQKFAYLVAEELTEELPEGVEE
jgi:hypothetical protein